MLNFGKADLTIANNEGLTPLVKGYLLLYKQPPESYVRAVLMVAQVAGGEAIKEARALVDEHVRKCLYPSPPLIENALKGNVAELKSLLIKFADPNSLGADKKPALVAAAKSGNPNAVRMLLEFNADPYLGIRDPSKPSRLEVIHIVHKFLSSPSERSEGENIKTLWLDVLMDFYSAADLCDVVPLYDLVRSRKFLDNELVHESTGFSEKAVEATHIRVSGGTAKDCVEKGISLVDVFAAGYPVANLISAFGLRKLESKEDPQRRVGARVLCEGKLGKIEKHQYSDAGWNYVRILYDDGSKNKNMSLGSYLTFANKPGSKGPTEDVWVGI